MAKNPEVPEVSLTAAQSVALPLLASGAKKKDAATAAGVCAQTVSEWLNETAFLVALEAQRAKLTDFASEQISVVIGKAMETVVGLMASDSEAIRFKAAAYLLDRVSSLSSPESTTAVSAAEPDARGFLAALGVICS